MLAPIRASAAAMANHALACHTKRKAWRLENGYNVFARGQAVCDLMMGYARVFDVGVKLSKVQSFRGFDKPSKDKKMLGTADHGQISKTSAKQDATTVNYD